MVPVYNGFLEDNEKAESNETYKLIRLGKV
jgi:hypothetical protein